MLLYHVAVDHRRLPVICGRSTNKEGGYHEVSLRYIMDRIPPAFICHVPGTVRYEFFEKS